MTVYSTKTQQRSGLTNLSDGGFFHLGNVKEFVHTHTHTHCMDFKAVSTPK